MVQSVQALSSVESFIHLRSSAATTGVLTLLVTPPPSLLAVARVIGSGCSSLGEFLPVTVFARDRLRLMNPLKNPDRGLVGDASGGAAPGEPFGETRVMEDGGRGMWFGRLDARDIVGVRGRREG